MLDKSFITSIGIYFFIFIVFYSDKYKDGVYKDYYDNGILKASLNVQNGFPVDTSKLYYKDGSLLLELVSKKYYRAKGSRVLSYKVLDADGKTICEYTDNNTSRYHNSIVYYYPDSDWKSRESISFENLSDGEGDFLYSPANCLKYDENSDIFKSEDFLLKVKRSDILLQNIVDKLEDLDEDFSDPYIFASSTLLYSSKTPYEESKYRMYEGKRVYESYFRKQRGIVVDRDYYDDGTIKLSREFEAKEERNYYHLSENKEEKKYYSSGNLSSEVKYVNGIGNYVSYFENGNIKSRGAKILLLNYKDIFDEVKDGPWEFYTPGGDLTNKFYSSNLQ